MYPVFKEYNELLTNDDIQQLYEKVNYSMDKLEEAQVYIRETKENKKDDEFRKCKELCLDNDVLKWLDQTVTPKLNKEYKEFTFETSTVEARIIHYDSGDFFAKHTDVINVHSNLFKSYSLLINLETCEEGGETVLYINDDFSHISQHSSKIRGAGLLFPKSLWHEGMPIKKGTKVILFMNYHCYMVEKDYILVETSLGGEKTSLENNIFEDKQSEKRQFVVPIEVFDGVDCMLSHFYSFKKREFPNQHVFFYEEKELTADEFEIFYKDLFNQSNYDFSNYDEIKEKMEYLCYQLKDIETFKMDKGYVVYPKCEMDVVKEKISPKTSPIALFRAEIVTIGVYIMIKSIYINDTLIFCTPDAEHAPGECGYTHGYFFNLEDCDCIDPLSELKEGECDHLEKYIIVFAPNDAKYAWRYLEEGWCIECLQTLYKLSETEFNIKIENVKKENNEKDEDNIVDNTDWDGIKDLFKKMKDESCIKSTVKEIHSEHGSDDHPELYLDDRDDKSTNKINPKQLNYICNNEKLNDEEYSGLINNLDVFEIVKDILNDRTFSSIDEDSVASYGGKYNRSAIYQTIVKEGIIDLNHYNLF
jgi:2OG-Fe(II) oxygenase superfamily